MQDLLIAGTLTPSLPPGNPVLIGSNTASACAPRGQQGVGEHRGGQPHDGLGILETHRRGRVRDHEIGVDPGRFGQSFMPGPDRGPLLGDHRIRCAATLDLVAQQAADEADVGGRVDEDPDVEQG